MNKDWIYSTNVYEVNLRQYTPEGTIKAFATHLQRLRAMGVETLWFMPLTPIAQKNKKGSLGSYYACSDYTSISQEFGTMNDWIEFVKSAHAMGFKVIIDWVANHTGWDHVWTVQHPDWYKKDESGEFRKASGMDDIIELDFSIPAVRHAMIDAMKFWVTETNIDGFRCDLAFWVELDFWIEAKDELDKIKPLFWLGELDAIENSDYMQVFDAAYTWKWMHKTQELYKSATSFDEVKKLLLHYSNVPGLKAWFTSNHDENSWNGTEYEKYGEMAMLLAVFSCTWPGIPLIYSGQELPNKKRLQFFEKDVIEWKPDCDLHTFYRTLLHLRNTNTALAANAESQILSTDQEKVFVYKRKSNSNEALVILNFSSEVKTTSLPIEGIFQDIFSKNIVDLNKNNHVQLGAWSWLVLVK